MRIPDKMKVGGVIYAVEISKALTKGINYTAEIDYESCVIRIRPMAEDRMERDFFHELMHAVFDACGYTEHIEEQIDRLAAMLHSIIKDNPHVFGGDADANPIVSG